MTKQRRPSSPEPSPEQCQLIDDLGGPAKVAGIVKVRTASDITGAAVSMWKKRGIPYRYRAPLATEARERGLGVPVDFLGEQVRGGARNLPATEEGVPWLE